MGNNQDFKNTPTHIEAFKLGVIRVRDDILSYFHEEDVNPEAAFFGLINVLYIMADGAKRKEKELLYQIKQAFRSYGRLEGRTRKTRAND